MSEQYQIHAPSVMMRLEPDESAEVSNEMLYGEIVNVLGGNEGDWIKVRADHDGYEGYIPFTIMGSVHGSPHHVCVPTTHIYSNPDFKSATQSPLYMGSRLATKEDTKDGFRELQHSGWVFEQHLRSADSTQKDYVETALLFENAPYLWGGRSCAGIDCSGLVQISLMEAGHPCPRDTKDQAQEIGQHIEPDQKRQRGDLVFFEGHVGIMIDEKNILNATSRHMRVIAEKLEDVIEAYEGIQTVRRLG